MRMQYKTALMTFAAGILGCVAAQGAVADEVSSYAPVTQERLENPEVGNWLLYRRTYDGHGFSPLRQINVRQQVEEIIGQGQHAPSGHIPFTPRAKKVLELSLREALQLGHNYIGTEHILLGLIREGEGVTAQVLVKLGADLNRVRQQVNQLLQGYQGRGRRGPAARGGGLHLAGA